MSERAKAIDESELRVIGIDALNVDVSKKLYENQSVEEIFKRAKEHWRG
jgi:hypothetical protein